VLVSFRLLPGKQPPELRQQLGRRGIGDVAQLDQELPRKIQFRHCSLPSAAALKASRAVRRFFEQSVLSVMLSQEQACRCSSWSPKRYSGFASFSASSALPASFRQLTAAASITSRSASESANLAR